MFKLMKADLYRILRGKAMYITIAGLILYIAVEIAALNFFATSSMTADLMAEMEAQMGEAGGEMLSMTGIYLKMNGINCLAIFVSMAQNVVYFLLPAAIVIAGTDFNIGTVKNILSRGCTRIQYFLSKYLLITAINIIILLIGFIASFLIGTVLNGSGIGSGDSMPTGSVIQSAVLSFLPYLGYSSVAVFLIFLFKRNSSAIAFYILFGAVPVVIVSLIALFNTKLEILADIFLYNAFLSVLNIVSDGVTTSVIIGVVVSVCYILLSICGSFLAFKQSEIK